MKSKIILPAAVFFAAGIITGFAARQTGDEAAFSPAAQHSIVLDAGHGRSGLCFKVKHQKFQCILISLSPAAGSVFPTPIFSINS